MKQIEKQTNDRVFGTFCELGARCRRPMVSQWNEKMNKRQSANRILFTDVNASTKGNLNLSCGDSADNITKEVIELIKMCTKSTMMFSKFIPTYLNHFGKKCRVADYGCTKLIETFEAMSSIVQVSKLVVLVKVIDRKYFLIILDPR